VGTTRGPDNRRSHDIKVSARITHQQLIVDVSYPTPDSTFSTQASANNDLAPHLHQQLNALLSDGEDTLPAVTEPGSKTGMLHYVPDALLEQSTEASVSSSRQYQHILLTGATGYIGSYALRELLKKTQAKVYCLIRPKANASAEERLQATLDNYFAGEDFQPYADRIQVISGDLRQANWQLESSHYQELSENIDAVYHFAADTRLMGSEEELAQANIAPLKQLLDFCCQRHLKDMHYMSTLAVCGVNPQPEAATFNEDTLDFGQEFQNSYEKTKFECEKLVNRFTLDGNKGFIYRTGNVSGHSVTAQFQRNAADNRLIQFLNACVQLGRLPHDKGESIALSPVDKVTEGVISLSLDKQVKPDTYHVDSTHTVSMTDLFRSIERKGIHFKDSNAENFRTLFQQFKDNKNPDVVLGRFWSSRKPRNVTFNHQKTDRYLKRLGVEFSPINHAWLSSFVGQLIQKNAIKRPNAEIVHIDQHRRRRIFDIPTAPSFPREAS
jgi:thioester reductase-like protein